MTRGRSKRRKKGKPEIDKKINNNNNVPKELTEKYESEENGRQGRPKRGCEGKTDKASRNSTVHEKEGGEGEKKRRKEGRGREKGRHRKREGGKRRGKGKE